MLVSRIEKIFLGLNCILITLLAYICIDLFYSVAINTIHKPTLHNSFQANHNDKATNIIGSRIKSLAHYSIINKRDIFGLNDETKKPEDISNLEPTELSLKLRGTMVSNRGKSYAIIVDEKQRRGKDREKLVVEGNVIKDAVLTKVFRNKVILNVDGHKEILAMEDYGGRRRSGYSSGRSRTSREPIKQKKTISRNVINRSLDNMNELLSQAKVRPHYKNGSPDGFLISRIKRNSLFKKLGLRNGDIIQEVNGEQIDSVDEALAIYQNLISSNAIDIKLKRRGRERIITYSIR